MPAWFRYGDEAIQYLKERDKKLGAAMDRIGRIRRPIIPAPFTALISSVVSQQISKKAAATVWGRLQEAVGVISPGAIDSADLSVIQACGMSARKAGYIKGIARAAITGQVDFQALPAMEDGEIIASLTALPGVGVWTAEMLLIFSLNRLNVFSYSDLAIRRGIRNLYGLKELTREHFEQYRARYSPYCSVASLYLWELSGQTQAK